MAIFFSSICIAGAALATVIGQACACIVSVIYFFVKGNGLRVSWKGYRPNRREIGRIYAVGVPSALMMAMPSVLVGIMNGILDGVSTAAVNFFGVFYKLQTLVYVPASGLVQGMRPIVGYNHGAKSYDRMRATVRWSLAVVGVFIAAATILFLAIPEPILYLFGADEAMAEMGRGGLRILSSGFLISAFGVILPGVFEALGMGVKSLLITVLRQLALIPPLALLLMPAMGLQGAWTAFPIAETAAAVVAILLYRRVGRRAERDIAPNSDRKSGI